MKLYNTEILDKCIRLGNIQILFLQGSVTPGDSKRIDFPHIFADDTYTITANGNYGSVVNIATKYKDCVFINVNPSGIYNTGKYELIAVGKFR